MTATDHLLRDLAPIPARAWEEIESEARSRLTPQLAARRVSDWSGPHGWREDPSAVFLAPRSERPIAAPWAAIGHILLRY